MRFSQPRQGDLPISIDLDSVFLGLDTRRRADLSGSLPAPGLVTGAVNVRFDNGDLVTRGGVVQPSQFNPPLASVRGTGVFSDPENREWLLVVLPSVVWMLSENTNPVRLSLPAGVVINERVRLVQAFNTVLMCRGTGAGMLVWEGDRFTPWKSVRQSAPSDEVPTFLEPPPNCDWAVTMADRVFYPDGRDGLVWSDVLDYTRVDYTLASARFNTGEDDAMVYAAAYQGSRLVIFKSQSIHFLDNVGGDMSGVSIPDRLPGRIGCVAGKTVAAVGQDLFWLGQGGLHRLSQTAQGEMRGYAVPVSEPISNIMARINWPLAGLSTATVTDRYYYLAVPLDHATEPNAVLVYDLKSETWQGVDYYGGMPGENLAEVTGPPTGFWDPLLGVPLQTGNSGETAAVLAGSDLVTTDWLGQRQAFFVGADHVTVLADGDVDRLGPGTVEREIYLRFRSRGYMLGALRTKQLRTVALCHDTKNACVSIAVETDGQNELQPLEQRRTRDRTRYKSHAMAPFSLSDGARFSRAKREDYTWRAGDAVVLGQGIPLRLFQSYDKPLPVRRIGRWFAVQLENFTGRIRVTGLLAEGLPEEGGLAPK